MKNIHILPTDKPSNIVISTIDGKLKLNNNTNDNVEYHGQNQNIYITSNEEIKEGDYYLTNKNTLCKCIGADDKYVYSLEAGSSTKCKKIILTTDQDLIKDGVQAIDDEFLEWFVKNPSCEEVKVELHVGSLRRSDSKNTYKIIIPKEKLINCEECGCEYTYEIGYGFRECFQCLNKWKNKIPKEEPINPNNQEVMFHEEHQEYFYEDIINDRKVTVWLGKDYVQQEEEPKQECCQDTSGFYLGTTCPKCNRPFRSVIQEPKQETLEEAAETFFGKHFNGMHYDDIDDKHIIKYGIALAKWQQEQDKNKFSEEEVTILLQNIINEIEIRKQNIISKSETMSVHLLEGGCMAFESSQDVVKEQFKQFKNK